MESETPKNVSADGSFTTVVATVLFMLYGGYLLFLSLSIGVPGTEPFDRFESEIPALTMSVMDIPVVTWVIGYVLFAAFLGFQSARPVVGRVMVLFNVFTAACGLLILYAVYFGVAVLPGQKIMLVLGLSP